MLSGPATALEFINDLILSVPGHQQ